MSPDPFQLYSGDCLEAMRRLPEGSVDLVVTDPPYGTTNLDFDREARRNKPDWGNWWTEIHRVAKPSAIIACFAAQPFTTDLINANRKNFRYDLVWHKTTPVGFLSANVRPLRAHESILIFCRRFGPRQVQQGEHLVRQMQSVYNPQFTFGNAPYLHRYRAQPARHYAVVKDIGEYQNDGRRHPTSVLTYARDAKSHHPTAKPVSLCRWLVRTYSHPGQTVLDPFAGGGSVAVAALEEERCVIACELDPVHYQVMEARVLDIEARVLDLATP